MPQRAAELLSGFAAELQLEIARRLVDLDETDAEVLAEVERLGKLVVSTSSGR